jgi:hypothetical protein
MKTLNHYLEATKEISTIGEYIPDYRRKYFMVWNADLPEGIEYNQIYESIVEGRVIKKTYIPLIGYELEEDQPTLYRNAILRAKSILGLR